MLETLQTSTVTHGEIEFSSPDTESYEQLSSLNDQVLAFLHETGINPQEVLFSGYNPDSSKLDYTDGDVESRTFYFGNETSLHPETQPDGEDPGVYVNPLHYALNGTLGVYSIAALAELYKQGKCTIVEDYPDREFGTWAFTFEDPHDLEQAVLAKIDIKKRQQTLQSTV